jgi:hypothetical protein
MKQIQIIYQPGYAGSFLAYLFSLDPSVASYMVNTNDVNLRLKYYNFNNTKKFTDWAAWHKHNRNLHYTFFRQTSVERIHPFEFKYPLDTSFYIVNLSYSDFANYWLISTKQRWNGYPHLRQGEIKLEKEIRKTLNPEPISIDLFFNNDTWEDEYKRVNDLMGLPLQLDAAKILYQSWYDIRVKPLKTYFENLTEDQRVKFNLLRKQREENND